MAGLYAIPVRIDKKYHNEIHRNDRQKTQGKNQTA